MQFEFEEIVLQQETLPEFPLDLGNFINLAVFANSGGDNA